MRNCKNLNLKIRNTKQKEMTKTQNSKIYNLEDMTSRFSYKAIGIIVLTILVAIGVYFFASLRQVNKTDAARVNNESITRVDFQEKLDGTKNFFEYKNQDVSKMPSLEKDVLQNLIDENLINQYGKNHNITVSDSEVLSRYDLVVKNYNQNNNITTGKDAQFLAKIKELYGTDKNTYLEQTKNDILKEKVQVAIKMPLANWLTKQKNVSDIQIY